MNRYPETTGATSAAPASPRREDDGPRCVFCLRPLTRQHVRSLGAGERTYRILGCPQCRIARTDPVPSADEMARFYGTEEYRRPDGKRFISAVEGAVSLFTRRKAGRIQRYIGRGSILDIGCGRGLLLAEMRRRGWSVMGAEFNEETASYARKVYGIEVIAAHGLGDLHAGRFDVVTLFHVLEHAERPDLLLASACRLLRMKGIIIIAVPNLSSLQSAFGREEWFHLDVPYHLHHFTQDGLLALFHSHGLAIRHVRQFDAEQNPFGWLQTLLNRSGIRRNLLYTVLRRKEMRIPTGSVIAGTIATILLLPVYFPIALLLSFLEAVIGKGGTIEVVAEKAEETSPGGTAP